MVGVWMRSNGNLAETFEKALTAAFPIQKSLSVTITAASRRR
jgi:hypothetical protein